METAFIGRLKELKLMSHYWQSDKASLVVLYGRRRVGKTRLLTHWLQTEGAYGLYWMAEAIAEKRNCAPFLRS
ncbi:MAG: ATP-binding protein [Chloroflexi bacterium]|nr:ATP-binding protein [Chloroflexota bacterium]